MNDSDQTSAWVTVAEAADKARVDSGTVRQWYRSGQIPTRRAEGERGAFLVPLELVLSLARPPATAAQGSDPSVEDLRRNVADRSSELADARQQLELLRAQLSELAEANRALQDQVRAADDQQADLRAELADAVDDRKGIEARLATVEAELTQPRRTSARSSVTDHSWLDEQTPAYQSPVRRQAMAVPRPATSAPEGGPRAPFTEVRAGELSDLLAATRPDGEPDPTAAAGPPRSRFADTGPEDERDEAASRAIWTDEAPHPPLGESPDDLLPEPDKKGRFGTR